MRSRIHVLFCIRLTSPDAPFCGVFLHTKHGSLVCARTLRHWVRPLAVLRTLVASALRVWVHWIGYALRAAHQTLASSLGGGGSPPRILPATGGKFELFLVLRI